jgi:hypothetical protein
MSSEKLIAIPVGKSFVTDFLQFSLGARHAAQHARTEPNLHPIKQVLFRFERP